MATRSASSGDSRRRAVVVAAAVAAVVVVVALAALIVSLMTSSGFENPDDLRSAMADAGFSCEPEPPSGEQGQLSIQGCALEDGGRVVLGVYESGDGLDERVASLRGQPRPLVYGDNWFIEAIFSPRPPENRELLTRMAERLDADTLNLDL